MSEQNLTKLKTERLKAVDYFAIPKQLREQNEEEFCKGLNISRTTLWTWKQDKDFRDMVYDKAMIYLENDLPDVLGALSKKAKTGDTMAIRLMLEHLNKFAPKQINVNLNQSQEDINVWVTEVRKEIKEAKDKEKNGGDDINTTEKDKR